MNASASPRLTSSSAAPGCYFNFKWSKSDLKFEYKGEQRYLEYARKAAENWSNGTGLSITEATSGERADIRFVDTSEELARTGTKDNFYGVVELPADWKTQDGTENSPAWSEVPASPHIPRGAVTISVNQYAFEFENDKVRKLDDFQKIHVLTHELGHALGLAHTQSCGLNPKESIMKGKERNFPAYNTPMPFDVAELKQLYGD